MAGAVQRTSMQQRLLRFALLLFGALLLVLYTCVHDASTSATTQSYTRILTDVAQRLEEELANLQDRNPDTWNDEFAKRTEFLPYHVRLYNADGELISKNATPAYALSDALLHTTQPPGLTWHEEDHELLATYVRKLPGDLRLYLHVRQPAIAAPSLGTILVYSLVLFTLMVVPLFIAQQRLSSALSRLTNAMNQMRDEETLIRPRAQAEQVQEIHDLYATFHALTLSVAERVRTIMRQRNELDVVLEGMVEAVIAIDNDKLLLNANHSAEELFEIKIDEVRRKPVSDIIRNTGFLEFIDRALASSNALQQELSLSTEDEQYFQVQASTLHDPDGEMSGVVLVLNDVTHLRHLQRVRQDFVANVSHELRTPITSIKGFLETLSDGALDDPADARRFVDIALKQTQRLTAIIDDLLMLSRIEQNSGQFRDTFTRSSVAECVESAIQLVELRAREKHIDIDAQYPEDCLALMSPTLMEQALVNLIENAIKYSEPNTRVSVDVEETADHILFHVHDRGNGIEAHHLPRLFERFYRIDRARSRKVGGTGLGLSIVRHIAQVHGGYPEVKSTLGKGSTFSIVIPHEID